MNDTRTRDGCARVRDRIDRYLDGALGPVEAARDQGHLEACAECARERARCEALFAAIRAVSTPGADDLSFARNGLGDRLRAAPSTRPRLRLLRGRVTRAVATAAAAIVALLALELVGSGLASFGSVPSWTGDLLEQTNFELPGWSEVFRDLWIGRDS